MLSLKKFQIKINSIGIKIFKDPRVLAGLFLGGLLLAVLTTPLQQVFDQMYLVDRLQAHSCCVIPIFLILYTLLTVAGIPGTVLTIVGGIIFGVWWGTLWSVVGATLGALGAFLAARYLFRDRLKHQFQDNKYLSKFEQSIKRNPFLFVLAIRFAPISPFNVVNFLFGLTPLHWLSYTAATFIGIIPGTFAYVWLGTSGVDALSGEDKFSFLLALGFLAVLSFMPLLIKQRKQQKR